MSNKNKGLQDSIPDTVHEFQINTIGRVTKKVHLGDFTCKIPTIKDQAMIARHEAMLNGEYPIYMDPAVKALHRKIAYLRFTLTDFPKFWRDSDLGYDLRDDNVIDDVYREVQLFEDEWVRKIWGMSGGEEVDESAEEKGT